MAADRGCPSRTCRVMSAICAAMCRLETERLATSSAVTSGMPPPSSVASVRASCEVANWRAMPPRPGSLQHQAIEALPVFGLTQRPPAADDEARHREGDQQDLTADGRRHRHDDARGKRQLRVEALVELVELRHHAHDDDRDDRKREQREHGRIDEGRDDPPLHGADDLHVGDVSPQHLLEAAAALARHQRRRVDRR